MQATDKVLQSKNKCPETFFKMMLEFMKAFGRKPFKRQNIDLMRLSKKKKCFVRKDFLISMARHYVSFYTQRVVLSLEGYKLIPWGQIRFVS